MKYGEVFVVFACINLTSSTFSAMFLHSFFSPRPSRQLMDFVYEYLMGMEEKTQSFVKYLTLKNSEGRILDTYKQYWSR